MNCCSNPQCQGIEKTFTESMAIDELKAYKKNGLNKTTRLLLQEIKERGVDGATLLDVGGGVGAIQLELIEAGVSQATSVDASPAYSKVAREEATRRGWADRINYHVGNFVDIAPRLDETDIVTLDRVICCYNDMPSLVQASVGRAKRLYGVIFPKDSWWIKMGIGIVNFFQRLFGNSFRIFAHSTAEIERLVHRAGFTRVFYHRGIFWQVFLYEK